MSRILNCLILALFATGLLAGCAGEPRVRKPGYLFYPSEIIQADKALMAAKAAGKDRECPAEYNALKAEVDRSYAVYHSCRDREAIEIATAALNKIKTLCPPKPVPTPPPPQAPVPAPAPVTPTPTPAPPVKEPAPAPVPPKAAEPKKATETLTLHVNFDVDKAVVRDADRGELNRAIEFIKKYPNAKFRIEGHTDSTGTNAYNQRLSEKRAESVKRYLLSGGGFDNARFSTAGFGETKPIDSNKTKKGRFNNRRVEISVVSE